MAPPVADLLFATSNRGKQREIAGLMRDLPLRLLFLQDVAPSPAVEETGSTFLENARLKAFGYRHLLPRGWVAAEDSGLVVPALGGEPGVLSARYGGRETDSARNELLLERMAGFFGLERAAHYEAVVVLLDPSGEEHAFTGRVDGFLAQAPKGASGFGYDPVFVHPKLARTFGEASQEDKDRLSHRGQAVRALRDFLEERLASRIRSSRTISEGT